MPWDDATVVGVADGEDVEATTAVAGVAAVRCCETVAYTAGVAEYAEVTGAGLATDVAATVAVAAGL